MSNKTRLDLLLVERGLEQTRQRAQAMIMSGLVFVDGQRVDKAGTAVPNDAQIEVRGNTLRYVSRGGLKLEKAMTTFGLKLDGQDALRAQVLELARPCDRGVRVRAAAGVQAAK